MESLSIILPAKNEAEGLSLLLPKLKNTHPDAEIIVVDDGSTDNSKKVCEEYKVRRLYHPYSLGNGAAVKSGARAANGDILVFLDADTQHDPGDIAALLAKIEDGYDMVIGARQYNQSQNLNRRLANKVYILLASFMTGFRIDDLTSGFRAVKTNKFRRFLYLLPNGFSYPTTITMAFLRSGFPITYIPVKTKTRIGSSKIRLLHDGLKFFIIILKIGVLFSPMRLFLPISFSLFVLGIINYSYTYIISGRFTNMSALLFIASIIIFLIGILSEQISSLHYRNTSKD